VEFLTAFVVKPYKRRFIPGEILQPELVGAYALTEAKNNVSEAARILGISPPTLAYRLTKVGLLQ